MLWSFVWCAFAIRAIVLWWCCLCFIGSRRVFGMVSDGFQAQKRGSWVPGKERAEKVLASATSIDGRKEWTCKFFSESNVWTRWRCRRCYKNIPAELHGEYRQAVAAKSGEWSTGSSASSGEEDRRLRSSEQGLVPWKRRKECKGSQASLMKKKGTWKKCGRVAWKLRMRPNVARNWVNRGKKLQKELREVDRLSFVSEEMQGNLKESLQHQLQEVEKRRNDLMPERQKVQKRTQNIQSLQDKRRNLQKVRQQKRRCGKSERKLIGKRSAFVCFRTKSIKTEWQTRRWKQSFMDCRLEKKEEVAMHRKRLIAAWRRCWSRFLRWGADQARSKFEVMCQMFFRRISRPRLCRCQEKKKEKGTVKMNNNKAEPVSSWCLPTPGGINQGAPSRSLELDLHRVRSVSGEGGSAGRLGTQVDRKRGPSRSPGRHLHG